MKAQTSQWLMRSRDTLLANHAKVSIASSCSPTRSDDLQEHDVAWGRIKDVRHALYHVKTATTSSMLPKSRAPPFEARQCRPPCAYR